VVSDLLLSVCALTVLVTLLAVFDGRVREELSATMNPSRATSQIASKTGQAQRYVSMAIGVVKDESQQNRPLVIMLAVGVGLTVIMFRM
jgi:hypothetical protein